MKSSPEILKRFFLQSANKKKKKIGSLSTQQGVTAGCFATLHARLVKFTFTHTHTHTHRSDGSGYGGRWSKREQTFGGGERERTRRAAEQYASAFCCDGRRMSACGSVGARGTATAATTAAARCGVGQLNVRVQPVRRRVHKHTLTHTRTYPTTHPLTHAFYILSMYVCICVCVCMCVCVCV